MGSYVPNTMDERQEMLSSIGLSSMEELYSMVPKEALLTELNLPEGLSEMEVSRRMKVLAENNLRFTSCFRGAGAYRHYIPEIVKTITGKEEFVTAYTPYQAEISQGVLQSIFEYQTQMCELTGLDVSNASVYDGAVAAAEGLYMCEDRKKTGCLVSETVNPETLAVIKTYQESRGVEVTLVPAKDGKTDLEALKELAAGKAGVYVESPNYFGIIEDMDAIVTASHEAGALVCMGVNPISLGLLKTPGELDVDIAVGEGQPLGMSLGFGGPYLGFMTCKKALMRKLPGRIVGQTVDKEGRRAFVLTLQAREQHIRREKASSNICSNEALCAMTASVYLAAVGPKGLREVATASAAHAHYLEKRLAQEFPGMELKYDAPFFHEFVTTTPKNAYEIEADLCECDILSGLPLDDHTMLWCCTELNSREEIDRLVDTLQEVLV